MNKFENVDILASLEAIMRQNTAFYQSDFEIDKEIIQKAASSPASQSGRSLPQTGKKPPPKRRRQNQNITRWRYEHEQIYR